MKINRNRFSRREFMGIGAAAAGASLGLKTILLDPDPLWALPQTIAPSDRVRFGMIGIGMQGSGLLANSIELPGVECAAACDLYDGRHTLAKEIVNRPDLPTTRRYHELLENKDIDCIVAAVPDHWHKQVVVDAVSAGKDIYIEKPMSHTAAEGVEMAAAAKKNGRIVQVGSQRVSSVICAKAKELVAQGVLGDLMLVEGSLGRNDPTGAWEYPPPTDLSPQTLDWDTWQGTVPKRAFDPLIFARWRCWKEYGTGVAGDLLVHLVSGMQYVLGINEAAQAGNVDGRYPALERWPKYAGRSRYVVQVRRGSCLHAAQPGHGVSRDVSLSGLEGSSGTDRVQPDLHSPGGRGYRAQLLRVGLSACHARGIFQEMAPGARCHAWQGAGDGRVSPTAAFPGTRKNRICGITSRR